MRSGGVLKINFLGNPFQTRMWCQKRLEAAETPVFARFHHIQSVCMKLYVKNVLFKKPYKSMC